MLLKIHYETIKEHDAAKGQSSAKVIILNCHGRFIKMLLQLLILKIRIMDFDSISEWCILYSVNLDVYLLYIQIHFTLNTYNFQLKLIKKYKYACIYICMLIVKIKIK